MNESRKYLVAIAHALLCSSLSYRTLPASSNSMHRPRPYRSHSWKSSKRIICHVRHDQILIRITQLTSNVTLIDQ